MGSKHIDEVIVTTDSEEIVVMAREFGASFHLIQPAELASDGATSMKVASTSVKYS